MTGLFAALNSATSGLRSVQANLKLVSDNVARADDPTRTRHGLEKISDRNGGIVGVEYNRRSDVFLAAELNGAIAREAGAETRNEYMTRVGEALGTNMGEPAVAAAATQFAEAWRALQTTPESTTARTQVVQLGERVAREIERAALGVDQIERDLQADLALKVDTLNRHLATIDRLNVDIVSVGQEGSVVIELRDQREAALRELSELVGVRTIEKPDGRLSVFTSTGLALVDTESVRFSFDGVRTVSLETAPGRDIHPHLADGKIGALAGFLADSADRFPPQPPSRDPAVETIRKLRSQLDAVAAAFTQPSKAGEPQSFADAYDNAGPTRDGELENRFFTGSDRFTLQVNPALLDGTLAIKDAAIESAADAIAAEGRSFSAVGLSAASLSYTGMVSAVLGTWSNAASVAESDFKLRGEFKSLLEVRYQAKVGVNLDEEIATLQELQTSYAASARVMQVTNTMFDALERILG